MIATFIVFAAGYALGMFVGLDKTVSFFKLASSFVTRWFQSNKTE